MNPAAPATTRRILLTGSAGAIGRRIAPALLSAGHDVRGFDVRPSPELPDHVAADLADADALDRAMDGRDTLIHLAAHPDAAPFIETLLRPNVVGLYQVMQAAAGHGVSRVVLASTIQVISGHLRAHQPGDPPIPTTARSPRNDYALTKVWAEDLGAMLAAKHEGMTVVAARIGWFPRDPGELDRIRAGHGRRLYLGHDDAGRFFAAAVTADPSAWPGRFAVAYAAAPDADGNQPLDLEPGRRLLGYEPRDVFPDGSRWD